MSDSKTFIHAKKNKTLTLSLYGAVRNFLKIAEILPFFFKSSLKIPNHSATPSTKSKNPRNILQNIDLQKVEFKLNEFLVQKNYTDEEIRLPDFAAAIGLSTHQASHYLNKKLKTNFSDFINFNRIEEAKRLILIGDSRFTLLDIAFESGFNSITTFHRACIKFAGCSPKMLRKKILENKSL
ncbi:helix-turn-helix domain-containing protein [Leptospira santarosai]|uniref:AraC family transcriptional regulator n=1 Tax=Leptospira santarosai TaxID=28183 RepID=A0AB73LX32_9LEPT|nr:helix-turn-helix domain-containing protein [Leptospira santarosai]MDI7175257.1 helix-turn-helix domain-containing protein [Leptospira santarosai]MDI7194909.1 helix-turn-helix domain-containing protein [Leptospira santarosai]MDO6399310.1 helix-turn-helix domain-containing protein [Leptospira santarosai]MDO6404750.1 helix-turn-helix domain-containing protein [Leptospira santarosai]ONF92611.1 AraC family transcriptional regulator [Leptospira santarosai]